MSATDLPPATRKWTADEVWQMVNIGLLEDEPYELIDGDLVYVSPEGEGHAWLITRLNMLFARHYGPMGYLVRVGMPVVGIVDSIPEPDLAVVADDLMTRGGHPATGETLLLVEVSNTSQRRDRRKGEIYAMAGAAEYWNVDIPRQTVTVHRGPRQDGTWERVATLGPNDSLRLPRTEVDVEVGDVLRP